MPSPSSPQPSAAWAGARCDPGDFITAAPDRGPRATIPKSAASLEALANRVRAYPGVQRKRRIGALTAAFRPLANASVIADFGEDCAVLEVDGLTDDYLLFALDAILPQILRKDPRYGGYASVLVNVLDVAAKGGDSIAIVDFVGSTGAAFERAVGRGMQEACEHLGVPLVGGHLHPDSEEPALAAAVLGRVPKASCVFSHTAQVGDALFFAADTEGERRPAYPLAWSPLRHKPRGAVQRRLAAVKDAAHRGLVHACKDASNPGVLGTIGMMLETSGVGATVQPDRLPRPAGVPLSDWVLMYQGCGFVMAADPRDAKALTSLMASRGLECARVGTVEKARRVVLSRGGEETVLFDLARRPITGIPPRKR